ncbi:hypothetical protein N0V90_013315 [Kalmusia sp. IMI 367209]|nr:hypothetical protein N0V90_013315 [Kalmusia sp. IMI 367209]
MDDPLPSYESTLRQDPWELVAPYLPSGFDKIQTDAVLGALMRESFDAHFMPATRACRDIRRAAFRLGLAEALSHFPNLVALDLSRTLAAKNNAVFSKLKQLRNLRVLRLRGLGLRDIDFTMVAAAIGTRVRSLDISHNNLTDASVRVLLDECMKEMSFHGNNTRSPLPPVRHGRPTAEVDDLAVEDLEYHIRRKLTQGFVGSLAVEEPRHTGITHLYMSDNSVTVEGYCGLLRAERLQVLDIGKVCIAYPNMRQAATLGNDAVFLIPGAEKLTAPLATFASKKLIYLRVSFDIITKAGRSNPSSPRRAELDGGVASIDALPPPWADSEAPRLELDAFNTGVYELPGDLAQASELPVLARTQSDRSISQTSHRSDDDITHGDMHHLRTDVETAAAELSSAQTPEQLVSPMPAPLLGSSTTTEDLSLISPIYQAFEDVPRILHVDDATQTTPKLRRSSTDYVADRRTRLQLRQALRNSLHPGMLPKLQTLVLTDVPITTNDKEVVQQLLQFVEDCAEEAEIAKLRARHTYMLPPGRRRKVAEREYANHLFALRRIVLEMAPPEAGPEEVTRLTKSSTEDTDSEALWEAAAHDFSFFSEEECGLPLSESGPPLAAMGGLIATTTEASSAPRHAQPETHSEPVLDVVAEVGRFRRERRAAYSSAVRLGTEDPFVEGYWPGDVTVVRRPSARDNSSLDLYGNMVELRRHYH